MKPHPARTLVATLMVASESALAIYLAFVSWLFAVWMVDDSLAFRMTAADWYLAAVERGLVICAGSLAFGAVVYPVNRWLVAPTIPSRPRIAVHLSAAYAGVIAAAGIIGCVQFAVVKPYM